MVRGMIWMMVAAACTSGGGGGRVGAGEAFTLELGVQTASNQTDLLSELDELELIVEYSTGDEVFPLDSTAPGSSVEIVVDPLDEVSLALVGYAGGDVAAFGRSAELEVSEGTASATLTLLRVDDFAWLDLPGALALSAVAGTGDGEFLISGGTDNSNAFTGTSTPSTTTDWLSLSLVSGSPVIATLSGAELPDLSAEPQNEGVSSLTAGRMMHSMTTLADGRLLIAGGSERYLSGVGTSREAYVWDPATASVTDQGPLNTGRALHLAALTASGNVVLAGGQGHTGSSSTFSLNESIEVYDPDSAESIERISNTASGPTGGMIASLGEDGVLVCGGLASAGGGQFAPSSGCDLVGIEGGGSAAASLPRAVVYGVMVPLPGGQALLTGGATYSPGTALDGDPSLPVQASNETWLYDGGSWSQVRPMPNARALHAAAALPDGRVLVAGGVSSFEGIVYLNAPITLACAEIYDPEDDTWEEVGGSCDETSGSGALAQPTGVPSYASDPSYGVLLVGGVTDNGRPTDQAALFVGAPALD